MKLSERITDPTTLQPGDRIALDFFLLVVEQVHPEHRFVDCRHWDSPMQGMTPSFTYLKNYARRLIR